MKRLFLYIPLLLLFVGCSSPSTEAPVEELDGTLDGLTLAYPIELSYDFMDVNGDYRWQYYYGGEYDGEGQPLYQVDFSMYYRDGYMPNFYRDETISFAAIATYLGYRADGSDYDGDIRIEPVPSFYTESNLLPDRKTYYCVIKKNNDLEYIAQGYGYEVRFSLLFPKLGPYRFALSFFQHSTCKSYASRLYDVILEEAPDYANGGKIIFKPSV